MPFIGNKPTAVPLSGADIQDGTITSADLQSGVIQNQSAFKNIIINGDMNIAQRGTSASGLGSSNGYNTCDRFLLSTSAANTMRFTQSQSTDVPSGQGFTSSLKMDCTTADTSLAAGDRLDIIQRFEGQNLQYLKKGTSSAESLTLSFWVKSNKTGTYICELYDNDNTRQISKSYTIDTADTWEKKTITFAGDTSGALDNDANNSVQLSFFLAAGSNLTSGTLSTTWTSSTNANRVVGQVNLADSTANEWYITGVQLEAGTSASDFEFLPYDVNLRRCERYYQVFNYITGSVICMGNSDSSTGAAGGFDFNTMRTAPTVTLPTAGQTSGTASYLTAGGAYPSTTGTFTANSIGIKNFRIRGSSYVGLTSAGTSWLYSTGNTSLTLDAEL